MLKKLLFGFLCFSLLLFSLSYSFQGEKTYEKCPFCDQNVLNAQKFYEDELTIALYTHKPVFPGHVLVIPKRHVERFEELSEEEISHLFQTLLKVNQAVSKVFGTTAYLILQKNGREVGQSVPHVHFHYIPRKENDSSALKFFFYFYFSNFKNPISKEEMKANVEKLKAAIEAE